MLTFGPGAAAAVEAGMSGLNMGMNFLSARRQRKWSEKMWEKQNRYNTPAAQVARMKAAGLSPALMYKGSPDNTAQAPQTYDRAKPDMKSPDIMGKILQQSDTKLKNQQLENLQGDLDNTKMRTITESYRALQLGAQTEQTELQSQQLMQQMQGLIRKTDADAAYAEGRVDLQKLEKKIAENKVTTGDLDNAFKEYRNELWKDSRMTMDDSMLLRMFIGVLQNMGTISPKMKLWIEEKKKELAKIEKSYKDKPSKRAPEHKRTPIFGVREQSQMHKGKN